MQIQNNPMMSNIAVNPSQPNVGDVLQVTVKERMNNQEAIVTMRGTTSAVKFEGDVPIDDKVLVEVTGKTPDGNYTVKVSDRNIATPASQQNSLQNTDSQVSEAVKAFTSRGMTVTKENINAIKDFLTNGNGTSEQKMDTLQIMAQKQIVISDLTIKSVHEALNGKPLSQSLVSVLNEVGVPYQPSQSSSPTSEKSLTIVRTEVQREPDVAKAIKMVEDFLKNTNLNEASKKTLENSVSQAKRLSQGGQSVNAKVQLVQNLVVIEKQNINSNISDTATNKESVKSPVEIVRNVIEKVVQEPARFLDQVKEAAKTTSLSPKVVEQFEKAVQETAKLQQAGQSVQARVQLTNALTQIEQQAQQAEVKPSEIIRQLEEQVAQEPNLTRALEQVKEVEKTASLPPKVVEQLEKAVQETAKLQQAGQNVQARVQLTNALTEIEQQAQKEEAKPNEVIRQVKEQVAQEPNLARAIDQVKETMKTASLPPKVAEQLEKAVQETAKLQQAGQSVQARVQLTNALTQIEQQAQQAEVKPSETIRQLKEQVAQEPNLTRALDQVKEAEKTVSLPPKVVEQLDKAVQETAKLQQAGQNVQARVQLTNALTQIEQQAQQEEAKPNEVLLQLKDKLTQEPNLTKAIEQTKEAMKTHGLPPEAVQKLQQAVQEATKLQQIGLDSQARIQLNGHINQIAQVLATAETAAAAMKPIKAESKTAVPNLQTARNIVEEESFKSSLRNLIKDVQKEPSLTKVLDKTAAMLGEQPANEYTEELKQAHQKAQQLEEQGRELAARREISNTLSKMEQYVFGSQPNANDNALSQAEQYVINEAIQTLKLDSQNVMVTEISKKLSQMAIDFKQLKREITKNLDNVSKMLENRNILPQANVKQILESTIHKLDNAILKSDFLLYTDMSTEKKLLAASSQLAEAKKLLTKGEIDEVNKLVKEVKTNIENIMFKPSDVKVKHFVSDKLGLENFTATKQVASSFEQAVQPFSSGESSSKQMYEALRKLGLTHENEAGFSLVSKSGAPVDQQQNENVKAALLKMMQNEDLKPQQMQQVEHAVQNITGQQLLNKQDSSGMQNLFFQLPYLMDKQVENIKIYVNSRKDGEKVDWENCSIYFVLETNKLGDIGVHLSSSEKNVSLTFRSNKEKIDEKVAGLTEITQERFKEIGYNLSTMNVQSLREQTAKTSTMEEEKSAVELKPTFTEKGYDFSI